MDNMELLNEDEWFRYGVKRITGESIHWSNYIADGSNAYGVLNGVLGTQCPVYIGTYDEFLNGGANTKEQILFYTKSGVRVTFQITSLQRTSWPMSVNESINMSQDVLDNTTWANVDVYEVRYSVKIYKYDSITQSIIREANISSGNTYAAMSTLSGKWEQYGGLDSIIRHLKYCAIYTGSRDTTYYNWITVSSSGWSYNLSLVWDGSNGVRITHTFNDYFDNVASYATLYEGIHFAKTLGTIPLIYFTNGSWFDEEIDGGVKEQNDDKAPWKDDTDDNPSGYNGRYGNYPSDDIGFPELPIVSALDTGFITLYCPTTSQLKSLVDYLWTSDWIDTIKKVINNPMDAVISLQLCPLRSIPYSASQLKIGAVNTGLASNKCTNQYIIADCGTVKIPENYSNALDYTQTDIQIYLPFIGVRSISLGLSMNSTLSLKYYVDILTGNSVAMLEVSKSNTSKSVYYSWDCNINSQIPITGANYSQVIQSLMSLGLNVAGGAVNPAVGISQAGSIVNDAANVLGGKVAVESHGSLSNNTGLLANMQPYVIVTLPKQSLPSTFANDKGYVSNISKQLSAVSGYTEVDAIHLDNIVCTEDERKEIESILKSGVVL